VTIYLVRHAHAGSRYQWDGDDEQRPLSARGRRQADQLADLLADRPIARLFSSPSRRCTETFDPLAARLGLAIEEIEHLAEGAGGEPAERFLLAHADEQVAACSHGDVIPRILQRLHAAGMRVADDTVAAKGSVWELDVDGTGAVVAGTYHPLGP
jgi:broad specificity phosphatase PhoE